MCLILIQAACHSGDILGEKLRRSDCRIANGVVTITAEPDSEVQDWEVWLRNPCNLHLLRLDTSQSSWALRLRLPSARWISPRYLQIQHIQHVRAVRAALAVFGSECYDTTDWHTAPPHRDECRALQITSATTDLITREKQNMFNWRSHTLEVDMEKVENNRILKCSWYTDLNLARCQSHQTLVFVWQNWPDKTWVILSQVTQLIQAKNHLHETTPVKKKKC